MKKALIALFVSVAAFNAQAVTTLTIENQDNTFEGVTTVAAEQDLLATSQWHYFWNLSSGGSRAFAGADEALATTLATCPTGSMQYELKIANPAIVNLGEAVYANGLICDNKVDSLTFNLGEEIGSINTWYQATVKATTLTLNLKATEASLAALDETKYFEYAFVSSIGTNSYNDVLAECDNLILNIEGLDLSKYDNVGVVTSVDDLKGETFSYGILVTNAPGGAHTLSVFVTAPEPATATLSLLALAGLAARRRRH